MLEKLAQRIEAVERRRQARSGELNMRVSFVPRGLSAEERADWRRLRAAEPGKQFAVHFIPWPPQTAREVEEAVETDGDAARVAEAIHGLSDHRASQVLADWRAARV